MPVYLYNIILVCASIVLLCFYSVETALVCVCVMRVESAAAALAAGEKMDGWMDVLSAVRIKRSPLSPPPVYVADNQTGFVSSTARVSLCACVCCCCCCRVPCGRFFVRVCIVRLYIILSSSSSPPHSLLSRALSLAVRLFFFFRPS